MAGRKSRLEIWVNFSEKTLTVTLEENTITLNAPLFPERFFAGILVCEGLNRSYDFSVTDE